MLGETSTASKKFTLRKLPFWGRVDEDELDFQWPTQVLLDQMPRDVRLQSLEFKCDDDDESPSIASIKVNLSHGFESEVFKAFPDEFKHNQKIEFDGNRPVKTVQGADNNGGYNYITAVKFMDEDSNQVSCYDPADNNMNLYPGKVHQIGDNEELIGVYG